MTTAEDHLPPIAELTRLANEFFSGLPGAAARSGSAPREAGAARELRVAPDPGSAPGLPEPTVEELAAIPGTLSGAGKPPDTMRAPPGGRLATATTGVPGAGNPVPVPTAEELAAIPDALTDVVGFVVGLPGGILKGRLGGRPPPASPASGASGGS